MVPHTSPSKLVARYESEGDPYPETEHVGAQIVGISLARYIRQHLVPHSLTVRLASTSRACHASHDKSARDSKGLVFVQGAGVLYGRKGLARHPFLSDGIRV
eukprot:3621714-Rhodomonas_salina.3